MLCTYLPLVPMQQGLPVMAQSMWGWLVWFPALFLVQIWATNGTSQGLPQPWSQPCSRSTAMPPAGLSSPAMPSDLLTCHSAPLL